MRDRRVRSLLGALMLLGVATALQVTRSQAPRMSGVSSASKKFLSEDFTWRVTLQLTGVAEKIVATLRFREEEGYEPPQGLLRVMDCLPAGVLDQAVECRWKLSEDPDDPKDSLWIWGLFKEPLYPYVLFSARTAEEIGELPAGTQLYFQGEHRRDPDAGVRLGEGVLTTRQAVTLPGNADAGTAFEPVPCGSFRFL